MANFQKDLAVIMMAAGYGSRLMPLTKILPKCLMPISDYPLIQYWIDYILALNIDKIALNTHYHHNKVLKFLDNNKYNSKVKVFHEPKLLGTAGTLRNIYNWSNRKTARCCTTSVTSTDQRNQIQSRYDFKFSSFIWIKTGNN